MHAFCHCLPDTWYQMGAILSAASCLKWVTALTGATDEASLLEEVEAAGDRAGGVVFLPYLSGERTPHNDPNAMGVFFGLTHDVDRAALARAVLEGVAFALADGQDALLDAGARIDAVSLVGGGARSRYWGRILASVLGETPPVPRRRRGGSGVRGGAARAARRDRRESVRRVRSRAGLARGGARAGPRGCLRRPAGPSSGACTGH